MSVKGAPLVNVPSAVGDLCSAPCKCMPHASRPVAVPLDTVLGRWGCCLEEGTHFPGLVPPRTTFPAGSRSQLQRWDGKLPSVPVGTTLVWIFRNNLSTPLASLPQAVVGKQLLIGDSGTIVPLLTSAGSTPWCASHAGTCMLHIHSFPRK